MPARDAELEQLRAERDEALAALARERVLVNALRLALRHAGIEEPPQYPRPTTPGEPPLRYRVADALNDGRKRVLAPVREALESALGRSRK